MINKQDFIRSNATENKNNPESKKVLWSRHAITELLKEGLTRSEVEMAFSTCEVIEDYPTLHRPYPTDCLVLGRLGNLDPVHAVVAMDEVNNRIFVVTLYRPLKERWKDDWRTRQ